MGPTERERRFLRGLRNHNGTEFNSRLLVNFCNGQFNSSLLLNSKFVLDEEFPHELKVAHREPLAELVGQACGKRLEQCLPIHGPLLALLLVLHDAAADLEVGARLERIHRGSGHVARGMDEAATLGDEQAEGAVDGTALRNGYFLLRSHGSVLGHAFGVEAEAIFDVVVQNEIQIKTR